MSVDAIEHFMIYREHPTVGAIVHVHAWIRDVTATEFNYPCGTRELATAVSDIIREAPDPGRTIVGLKNHGLTITGPSLEEIFERIEPVIEVQVPMSAYAVGRRRGRCQRAGLRPGGDLARPVLDRPVLDSMNGTWR